MRRLLPLLALTLMLALAGCGSDTVTSPEESIAGTYALVSINGSGLPLQLMDQGNLNVRVTSGAIILNKDGTYSDRTTYLVDDGTGPRSEDDIYQGTFTKTDTGATLLPDGYDAYFVTINGSRMAQVIGAYELEYSR